MLLHITSLICTFSLAAQTCLQDGMVGGLTQTPKQIITQSGKSATISCVVTSTESITGVHLRKHFSKILYVNSRNKSSVYNEDKRIVVTGTVGNFNVTINDLKEQDSATYLCDGQTDSETDLCGRGTVLAVASGIDKRHTEIMQVPKTIIAQHGDSVSITCTVTSKKKIRRVWLQNQSTPIVHLKDSNSNEIERDYRHRLSLHGTFLNFTVTLHNVSAADTGYYLCKGDIEEEEDEEDFCSQGTLIVIDANSQKEPSTTSLQKFSVRSQGMFTALLCLVITLTVTLLLVVACFMSYRCNNKKYQLPRNSLNTVYEDMTLRRDTISSPNCYSNV